jgi:protocatechuate 3,4-dioxygenase beta subunit
VKSDEGQSFSRATALRFFGGTAVMLAGCGGSGGASSIPAAGATPTPSAAPVGTSGACAVTPEGEIGPYFTDDSLSGFNRSNILANLDGTAVQAGVPLTLTVQVYDTQAGCAAMSGVQIDVWHCSASGVYSDEASENTSSQTWLRGYQITGSAGTVTFTTIVPGWYQGRATHIHVRARSKYNAASSTGDGSNTTQLFFPQAVVDALSSSVAPYDAHGVNPTTNASDHVYTPQTKGKMELVLSGTAGSGYVASVAIGLPIA